MECRDYEVTEEKIFTTEALRALRSARENFSSAVWEKTCAANDQNFVFPPVLFQDRSARAVWSASLRCEPTFSILVGAISPVSFEQEQDDEHEHLVADFNRAGPLW